MIRCPSAYTVTQRGKWRRKEHWAPSLSPFTTCGEIGSPIVGDCWWWGLLLMPALLVLLLSSLTQPSPHITTVLFSKVDGNFSHSFLGNGVGAKDRSHLSLMLYLNSHITGHIMLGYWCTTVDIKYINSPGGYKNARVIRISQISWYTYAYIYNCIYSSVFM